MTSTEKRSTAILPDAESRDAGIRICKAAFRQQMHTPIAVNMTPYCEAYVLVMEQWYTATVMQLAHSTILKWSPASHMRTAGYYDARSKSSHHCPKARQGAVANDIEIEPIGTPHTTVSQQAEQVTTRHSRCNDVEIERNWYVSYDSKSTCRASKDSHWTADAERRPGRRKIVCR